MSYLRLSDANFPPDYTDVSLIGRGAFAGVYRARNLRRGQIVALKCCLTRSHTGASWEDEKSALQQLHHPNIVKYFSDFSIEFDDDHLTALELEFVDGTALEGISCDHKPENEIFEIAFQVALALDEVHRHGIMHLDVKPDNLLVTKTGQVKLIDFGIAELGGNIALGPESGRSAGSRKYMAVELTDTGECTQACDVWSFGVVLLWLLDQGSFQGFDPVEGLPERAEIRKMPGILAALCCRMLDTNPLSRPTMADIVEELSREIAARQLGPSLGKVLVRYERASQIAVAWLPSSLTVGDFLKEVEGGDIGRKVVCAEQQILGLRTSLSAVSGGLLKIGEIGEIEEPVRRGAEAMVKVMFSLEGTSKKNMIRVPESSTVQDFLLAVKFAGGAVKWDDCELLLDQPIADYLDAVLVVVPPTTPIGQATAPIVEPTSPLTAPPVPIPTQKITFTMRSSRAPTLAQTRRPTELDLAFVIDATQSMQWTIRAVRDFASKFAVEFRKNRRVSLMFGAVAYRDPVDNPMDEHEEHPFNNSVRAFQHFLARIHATGGGDKPEDYVGALRKLLDLAWRPTAHHGVVWITDAPAHGRRFCGMPGHDEEEPKLEPLVRQLAGLKATFRGFTLSDKAHRTFEEMARIYEATDSRVSFQFVPFKAAAKGLEARVKALGGFVSDTLTLALLDFYKEFTEPVSDAAEGGANGPPSPPA
jgi:hypothetical protein